MKDTEGLFGTPISSHSRFISRRQFISIAGAAAAGSLITPAWSDNEAMLKPRTPRRVNTLCQLAVARGENPAAITRKAIDALGGIGRFVRRGDTVVIKPNISWDRAPEYATTTNPDVVAELVRICLQAGARRVRVFDYTANRPELCYRTSRIQDAVKSARGDIEYIMESKFTPARFPEGSLLGVWPLYRDAVKCDCLINVPIAKRHVLTGLTLSMKNLMGVCGGNRGKIHWNIDRKLAELTAFIRPDLTVIDAYRILHGPGPIGGFLKDVKMPKTVIATTDPVLADAYAATLFDINPRKIEHIRVAEEMRVGTANFEGASIRKIIL